VLKDKFFFFGSVERIDEERQLDFKYPDTGSALVNQLLRDQEAPYDVPTELSETRAFIKFDQQAGRHQLTQQVNYTDSGTRNFLPLSSASSLPSARNDTDTSRLLVAFSDTALLGNPSNPYVLTLRGSYRSEDSTTDPSQTDLTGSTLYNPYDSRCTLATCSIFGNLPTVTFGNIRTASFLDQQYAAVNGSLNKLYGSHDLKVGMNFLRTVVDGLDARLLQNQLFASTSDFEQFGAATAGVYLLADAGGLTPRDDEIHLRNNYTALFVQDDWRLHDNLTINLGLRWDYDSEFEGKENFAPRVGASWTVTPRTVVRGSFGIYYDQFRLGLARNVPAFGGTDQRIVQYLVFPRGLYGSPSFVSSIALLSGLPGGCFANNLVNLTDAQIAESGQRCPLVPSLPFIGVDRLNNVVAPGRSPVPANTVITADNVQTLTGLTPQQYADQASAAIGQPTGYFTFGPTGLLTNVIIPAQLRPTAVAESFDTPHTLGFTIGVQRELTNDMAVTVDYFHRDIRNLLGMRNSNIAFESRVLGRRFLPPFTQGPIRTFGPFYEGTYDALVIDFRKRFSGRFALGASYTYADATDNSIGIESLPSDSFVGTVPPVTEPSTGRTNADGPFTRANGTLVQQAGTFLNGPDRDKGPSGLALDHVLQINGTVELPYQFVVSGIFRAQSGFRFSRTPPTGVLVDPDGDASVNGIDVDAGRNAFTAPALANLDMRFTKRLNITKRVKADVLLEFFNILNRQNPAAVGTRTGVDTQPFGEAIQVLPGREGQIGFRIEF
jgi:hypothetical protein